MAGNLLQGCGNDLIVLIETAAIADNVVGTGLDAKSWTFVYSLVKSVQIQFSATPSQHPIPYQTVITDNVQRNMDVITITGKISCASCGDLDATNTNIVIKELKMLSERSIYSTDYYVTLTSNDWLGENMILTSVTIDENQDNVMMKDITTVWQGANLTGDVQNANFKRGGIRVVDVEQLIP